MLVTWLVEIWLNQLGKAADVELDEHKLPHDKEIMQEEFRLFLANSNIRVRIKFGGIDSLFFPERSYWLNLC